eukprot:7214814-Pyramimonas_sp.AAC.1
MARGNGGTFPTVILAVCGSTGGARDWSDERFVLCQGMDTLIFTRVFQFRRLARLLFHTHEGLLYQ